MAEGSATSGPGVLATYSYDALGRRVGLARAGGAGAATTYGYDGVGRLSSLGHDASGTAWDLTLGFGYSPSGQVVSRSLSNDAYAYGAPSAWVTYARNGLNQYTAVGGAAVTHDARGNLTSDGVRGFSYDLQNRLTGVTGVADPIQLTYDPLGRLARLKTDLGLTHFIHDGDRLVAEYDASGQMVARHVHGPSVDEPLVSYGGAGLAERTWLLADHLGSVIGRAGADGTAGAPIRYSAWGEPQDGNWSALRRFGFTGQMGLADARLYHYRARVYDPALGRFLQTDPIGYEDGLNWYAYVGNDPLNAIDPSGTQVAEAATAGCAVSGPACPAGALAGAAVGVGILAGAACAASSDCREFVGDTVDSVVSFARGLVSNSDEASNGDRGEALGEDGRLSQDETGKVHGNLPQADEIPHEGVADSIDALEGSIEVRTRELERYPQGNPNGTPRERRQARAYEGHEERIRRERGVLLDLRRR